MIEAKVKDANKSDLQVWLFPSRSCVARACEAMINARLAKR